MSFGKALILSILMISTFIYSGEMAIGCEFPVLKPTLLSDNLTKKLSDVKKNELKIGVFSKYDYAEVDNEKYGNATIFMFLLEKQFNIKSKVVVFENSDDALSALKSNNIDMIFGLRQFKNNEDTKITFAEPLFARALFIVANNNKLLNVKQFNIEALYNQDIASYEAINIQSLMSKYLNAGTYTQEFSNLPDIISTVINENRVNYGIIPADMLEEAYKLTKNIFATYLIRDFSGRIAIYDDNLKPLIEMLNNYGKKAGDISINGGTIYCNDLSIMPYMFKNIVGLSDEEQKFLNDTKSINVFVDDEAYPLAFINDKKEYNGIYIDQFKQFTKLTGIPIRYFNLKDRPDLLTYTIKLKHNEILFGLYHYADQTPESKRSIGYFNDYPIVYALTGKDLDWRKNHNIGVIDKSPVQRYMEQIGMQGYKGYINIRTLYEALNSGEIDFAITLEAGYNGQLINGNHHLVKIEKLPVLMQPVMFEEADDGVIGSLFSLAMNSFINYQQIESEWRSTSDRTVAQIMEQYYTNIQKQANSQVIMVSIIGVLILVAIFLFYGLRARSVNNSLLLATAKAEKAANMAKSNFLSNMSHEIRTPLNAILGVTQVTLHSNDPKYAIVAMEQIQRSGKHLLALINDILDMSKIEAGKFEIAHEIFNLWECIKEAKLMIDNRSNEKGIHFEMSFNENLPQYLIGDRLRVHQILINLLSNAVKFTQGKGSISLDVEIAEDTDAYTTVDFIVTDNGIGISKENIERIFAPFEQADISITRSFGGTGLGLAISNKLAALMSGSITVKSIQNQGSEFTFRARFVKPTEEEVEKSILSNIPVPDSSENSSKPINVMIVDDATINRVILMKMLERENITLCEAKNGKEALEIYLNSEINYFNVILMDIHMPEMNGYEASKAIRLSGRQDSNSVQIIALTASAFKEDVEEAMNSGMNNHLSNMNYSTACNTIEETLPQSAERDMIIEFVRTSKRGIIKPYNVRKKDEDID